MEAAARSLVSPAGAVKGAASLWQWAQVPGSEVELEAPGALAPCSLPWVGAQKDWQQRSPEVGARRRAETQVLASGRSKF